MNPVLKEEAAGKGRRGEGRVRAPEEGRAALQQEAPVLEVAAGRLPRFKGVPPAPQNNGRG